jgi:predicted phosphate transport protein (TIGR00153 family)
MTSSYLSGIFGASPVRPLQTHMEKVIDCVTELNPFIEAVLSGNAEERDRLQALIVERENEADALKKELRMHLPKSLFMPVDRRDVLEVLAFQDRVAGGARSVAGLIVGRQLNIPDPLKEPYRELVSHCIDACHTAYSAIRELDELLETGFGPNEVEVVSQILQRAGLLDLAALAKATGLVPVPVSNTHRGHGWHGNLVLVREGAVRRLRQIALPGLEPRGALVADLDLAMGPVRVVAAHLGLLRHSRLLQVEMLLAHAGDGADRPVVLMGDMNEWRRQGRSALSRFAPGFGPIGRGVPSFPSYFPVLALDRVLVQPEKLVERIEAHDTPLSRLASDHLPVKALIRLDGSLPARPVHPEAPVRRRLLSRLLEERPAP